MTGPTIEYIIRQIRPVDKNIVSVKYDIQVSFLGPYELTTGPFIFRESIVEQMSADAIWNSTSITRSYSPSGPFNSNVLSNFQVISRPDIEAFYTKAYRNAQVYFTNCFAGRQTVCGYTGPNAFTGSGMYNYYYHDADR